MPTPREKPARVLFIGRSAWSEHGGIQRFNRRVAAALGADAQAAQVLMVADCRDRMPDDTGTIRHAGFAGSFTRFLKTYLRAIFTADVLLLGHINFVPLAVLCKILRPRCRVILFAHGIEVWNDPRYRTARWYEPFLLRAAVDKVAIVSRYSEGLMARAFGLAPDTFALFPNSIDVPDEPRFGGRPDSTNILVVSRLATSEGEKHVDKVIRALAPVRSRIPTATLTIVGDGGMRQDLQALADELGIADAVTFAGFVDEDRLVQAYRDAAVFALPSSKEGFGIVYLEAWAKGIPVIASRFGAAPEVVEHGADGYTVDPEDTHDLAERLIQLLGDREQAKLFAQAGWAKVTTLYSDRAFRERLRSLCAA